MIKIICDNCGRDCDNTAYDVLIRCIHNPVPKCLSDQGDLQITDEPATHLRFILCSECYREQYKLPNIYECRAKHQIVRRGGTNNE